MSTIKLIKLGESFELKYSNVKLAAGMSEVEVKNIIINASHNFMVGEYNLIQALNNDNIFADTTIKWEGFWSPKLTVSSFRFNPSISKEITDKYNHIPAKIQEYLQKHGRQFNISGGPWNIRLP